MQNIKQNIKVVENLGCEMQLHFITEFTLWNQGTSKVVYGFGGETQVLKPNKSVTFEAGLGSVFAENAVLKIDFKNRKGNKKNSCIVQYNKLSNVSITDLLNSKPVLHLNLKAKWFDMILSGEKTEEYREIKDYWMERFDPDTSMIDVKGMPHFAEEVIICFSNGYSKNRRQFYIECRGIRIGRGNENWGATPNDFKFIILLGKILSKVNC